jgi:Flp pilus assembly protein TadG
MRFVAHLRRMTKPHQLLPLLRSFVRTRRSTTAVEFAIVGSLYVLVLLFAVEGGIFYLKIDILDLATERASRFIILNNLTTAPASAGAFASLIANNGNGALTLGNIAVSVRMAAPISGTTAAPVAGFQSLTAAAFTPGTYQYVPGACALSTNVATNVTTVGACTGGCQYPSVLGAADQGYQTTTNNVTTLHQTYTCSAGQDILVQVQYTDSTLTKLIAGFFGPVTSTLAFQAEPTLS